MKCLALTVPVLVIFFALAGCNPAALTGAVVPAIGMANKGLAELSGSYLPEACKIFDKAVEYYDDVKGRYKLPTRAIKIALTSKLVASELCDPANPPSDVFAAIGTLTRVWFDLQAATHVPGTK